MAKRAPARATSAAVSKAKVKKGRTAASVKKAAVKKAAKVAGKALKSAKANVKRASKVVEKRASAPVARAKKAVRKVAATVASTASALEGTALAEGVPAPAFELEDETGEVRRSAELGSEPYVLYFYPKDDTPGCTAEACGFRDTLPRFSRLGVKVFGVSPDSIKSHGKFRDKYGLNFSLLSDPDKALATAYGVWTKKTNYGREYMGIERSTFLIDADGKVRKSWRKVRVPGHVDAVLEEVKKL